jgi:hypothetical protein
VGGTRFPPDNSLCDPASVFECSDEGVEVVAIASADEGLRGFGKLGPVGVATGIDDELD